ncbi:MAG: alanine racemase [Clostridiales Family XIII bacterium]|jgi:alanine racemase|nr:alanine racemase [Clostridiales Family XIII bacterium]
MHNEARRAAWVEISLGSIADNFREIKRLAGDSETICCIKADAYGHGIVKTAWELIKAGADAFGVATIMEAVALRSAGIRKDIILLSATPRGNFKDVLDQNLTPVITSVEDARLLSEIAERTGAKNPIPYYAAVETGMGRLGFLYTEKGVADIVSLATMPHLRMKGIFSHFATSDETDLSYAHAQLRIFDAFATQLIKAGVDPGQKSIANSAAIMMLPEANFDVVRPGIVLYGLYPSGDVDKSRLPLSPSMSVRGYIVYLKKVPSGFSVSYGRHFTTARESLIATISIGYGDGLPRILGGKGRVIVRGRYAPIVGTICMDQFMIDVTDVPGVTEYDEITVLGEQDGLAITAGEIAELAGTISYEIVCRFGQRLPKIYT